MTKAEKLGILTLAFFLILGLAVRFYRASNSTARLEVVPATFSEKTRSNLVPTKRRSKKARKKAGNKAAAEGKSRPQRLPLNVNSASPDDLESLPLIGKSLAGKIVEYRGTHGPFKEKNELLRVENITISVYRKIAPYLAVE